MYGNDLFTVYRSWKFLLGLDTSHETRTAVYVLKYLSSYVSLWIINDTNSDAKIHCTEYCSDRITIRTT